MAQQYVGLNRGQQGFKVSDFTVGTSTGSTDFEVRYDDSKSLTRHDLVKMLKAVRRFYEMTITTNKPGL